MEINKGQTGCFVLVIVVGLVLIGGYFLASGLNWFEAQADEAAAERHYALADQARAEADRDRVRGENWENKYILFVTSLAAFQPDNLACLFSLPLLGLLALAGGFAIGLLRKVDKNDIIGRL